MPEMNRLKNRFPGLPIILSVIIILLTANAFALYPGRFETTTMPKAGGLIIKLRPASKLQLKKDAGGVTSTGLAELDKLNSRYQLASIHPLLKYDMGPTATRNDLGNILVLSSTEAIDWESASADYAALPEVEYAEPDYLVEFYGTPNDSLYQYQWNLHNTGQEHYHVRGVDGVKNDIQVLVTGLAGADIAADTVFQNPPDKTSAVIVAIIDTGADILHPDLADNIWTNPGEIAGNGLDDDNNGYIDDIHGWDFTGGDFDSLGDNDPSDSDGHGTHCAGIVAAVIGNDKGIAGIAQNCRIMPLKIIPWPLTSRIAAALIYAADNGADVANMSFGYNFRTHLMEEALQYARQKGVILCAAAGNDFTEQLNYPAGYESVIAVGATNDSDMIAPFSTYGDHLDISAPGHSILSLRASGTDMYGIDYPQEPKVHIVDSFYYIASGTSMACPHVVGVAAYLRAVSPGLTPDKAQEIIEQTADDIIDPYGVGWNLPGFDKYSGFGRINLFRALEAAPKVAAIMESPAPFDIVSGTIDIIGTANGDDFSGYSLFYGSGDFPQDWIEIGNGSSPVTSELLGSWNTTGLSGLYTIKLVVGAYNITFHSVWIINSTAAQIITPVNNDTVANAIAIIGNAYGPNYSYSILEYGAGLTPLEWDTLALLTTPIFEDQMAGWIVEDLPPDLYTIRLLVHSTGGLVDSSSIVVHTESIFSSNRAWKTIINGEPAGIATYADLDNDNINEIIIGTTSGIEFYTPDGTPKNAGMPVVPPNNFSIPIAIGNLDGDGIDDMVAVGANIPMIYGYPSGAPAFRNYLGMLPDISSNLYSEFELPKLSLRDSDNDGLDEIHLVVYNGEFSKVFIFESDGSLYHTFNYSPCYLPVDLDNNGIDELYTCNYSYGMLRRFDYESGLSTDSLLVQMNGSTFNCMDLSAYDIDGDYSPELIVFGYYADYGYFLYAFEPDFQLLPGWPHDLGMDDFVIPTNPIFGDIDNNGTIEYFCTYFDYNAGYILAWNLDGTSYLPGNPDGLFATVPKPAILNMLLLSDINGDGAADIIGCAINDIFFSYDVQRLYGWDNSGKMISGFPIIVQSGKSTYIRYTPIIGDIDRNGQADMLVPTADSGLAFINFPGSSFRECGSPVPSWRYNRRMNNIGYPTDTCNPVDVNEPDRPIPYDFRLSQNYPNPFNASTRIDYSLTARSKTTIVVYDLLGRKVKTLVDRTTPAGQYSTTWDGINDAGQKAASGIYFARISAGNRAETIKLILLK
jgi:subtilisin family serine protease